MKADFRGRLLLGGTAGFVLAIDQLSKAWVVANLPSGIPTTPTPWLGSILSFTYITNTGVAFGLFPQFGDFFTWLAVAVVAAILIFQRSLPANDGWMHLALGLQVGGALGNLVDRIFRGSVVDFIDTQFWPVNNFAIFNVADSAIVAGVALLIILSFFERKAGPSDAGA